MIRHYSPLVHRCDARCRTIGTPVRACDCLPVLVSLTGHCAHATADTRPEWVRRAQSGRMVAKDLTRA